MNHSVKNSTCSFHRQMSVVLRTYLTRWEFYVIFLLGAVVSIGFLLIASLTQNALSRGPETSQLQDKSDYLFPSLVPVMFVGPWLGMHLKQQFAAPRSRLVPGFAKAHLAMAACLMALLISLTLVSVWMSGVVALSSMLAIQLAACAWMLWLVHLNSGLMTLLSLGLFFGVRHFEDSATQALFFDWFLGRSVTIPSFLLLTAGVAGLWAYACRLARCHEAMPEYGTAISMGAAWYFTSRSANRSRQQMEATVISKSVVIAWLLDRQFEFVMRHLPKHWLAREVILLQVSHGLPILRLTLVVLLIVLAIGGVSVVRPDGSNNLITFAATLIAVYLPCVSVWGANALWLRHWRWCSSELLRPMARQRYVASVLTAIAVDGLGGLLLAMLFAVGVILSGRTLPGFSSLETFLLYLIHASSYVVTATSLIMWSTTSRRFWPSIIALSASMIAHGVLIMTSISLGSAWLGITLPVVLVGSIAFSGLVVFLSWQDWNSIEFA